jgi:hypothetical protein
MRNKIGILIAFMLLSAYILPLSGIASEQDKAIFIIQNPKEVRGPPDPGHLPEDFEWPGIFHNIPRKVDPPDVTVESMDDTIIEIIEQIDESLVLGYLEDLVDFGPRVTGSQACWDAGDYIYDEFESMGLDARFHEWSYGGYSDRNVEATLEGIDPNSDEIYIILAHYDSVSGSPGADDDGSGTVAVLVAAYIMSQYEFNHTIKFLAVSGEEQGLLGSHEYAEEAYNNGDNIVGALNGDMIGFAISEEDVNTIKIYFNTASEWLLDFTTDISQEYEDYFDFDIYEAGYAGNSDHASFWQFSYDAIFYHEYNFNDYYHSPQDTIENMNISYCTKSTKFMIATLGELAQAQITSLPPEKPTLNGQTGGVEGEELTFTFSSTDPEGDNISYFIDWGDGTNSGWLGPYASGETGETTNSWEAIGTYEVKVKARDINKKVSDWSDSFTVTIVENQRPNKVTINGPNWGFGGTEYEFTFVSTDPENHDIYYRINWDDGDDTGYIGPYSSGETITLNHKWKTKGTYWIKAWAMDVNGGESLQHNFKINILTNGNKEKSINFVFTQILGRIINRFPVFEKLLSQ